MLWDFLPGWLWDYPLGGTGAALPLGFPPGWLRGDPPSTARALGISFGLNAGCPSGSECFGCTPGMALSLFQHLLRGLLSSSGGDFPPWRPPKGCLCVSALSSPLPSIRGKIWGQRWVGWGQHGGDPSTGSHRGAHRRLPEKEQKAPRPSWKKRINKERGTASGFFKLRVSGPVFFSPLARRPAGTLSRRRGRGGGGSAFRRAERCSGWCHGHGSIPASPRSGLYGTPSLRRRDRRDFPMEIRDVTALLAGQSLPAAAHPRHGASPGTLTPPPHRSLARQRCDFSASPPAPAPLPGRAHGSLCFPLLPSLLRAPARRCFGTGTPRGRP